MVEGSHAPNSKTRRRYLSPKAVLSFLVSMFLLVILWHRIVYIIPAGSAGVLWLAFFGGTVHDYYFKEGVKVILPWDMIYIYDNRLKRKDLTVTAYGQDGLSVRMDVTLNYSLNDNTNPLLHEEIGPEYEDVLIVPELTAAVSRSITSREGKELYSIERDVIESEIITALQNRFDHYASPENGETRRYLSLDGFNIREIHLPDPVIGAIEAKLAAEQQIVEQTFIKQKKIIEAEGIKKFQEIVTPGITDNLLRWQGIDATLKLSQSKNSKIVVIGNGKSGMPLILDGWEGRHSDTTTRNSQSDFAGK